MVGTLCAVDGCLLHPAVMRTTSNTDAPRDVGLMTTIRRPTVFGLPI